MLMLKVVFCVHNNYCWKIKFLSVENENDENQGEKIRNEAKLFYKTASIFSLFLTYKFDCALIEKVLLNNSKQVQKRRLVLLMSSSVLC